MKKPNDIQTVAALTLALGISCASTVVIHAQSCCTQPPYGLVSWWKGDGNTVASAGTNLLQWVGVPAYSNGLSGEAFSFDGVTNSLQVSGGLSLAGPRTYEAWIFPRPSTGNGRPIITSGTSGSGDFFAVSGPNSGYPTNELFVDHWGYAGCSSGLFVVPNQWNHVALIYDGTWLTFYVNGVAGNTYPRSLYGYSIGTLRIGGNTIGGSSTERAFNGLIDEVSIYNRALSAQEVQAIWKAGSGGKCLRFYIIAPPADQVLVCGATATFSIVATNELGALSYQWQFGSSSIAGATDSTLVLTNVSSSAAGVYSVDVYSDAGQCLGTSARLAFSFLDIGLYFGLTIHDVVGSQYRIEYAESLTTPTWTVLTNVSLPMSPYTFIDYDSVHDRVRFYRAVSASCP
jgi:hypothetical protein